LVRSELKRALSRCRSVSRPPSLPLARAGFAYPQKGMIVKQRRIVQATLAAGLVSALAACNPYNPADRAVGGGLVGAGAGAAIGGAAAGGAGAATGAAVGGAVGAVTGVLTTPPPPPPPPGYYR
jgi:hypothetical protein